MENLHTVFREMNEPCASARLRIAKKSKTVMSWNSRKKREDIFCFVLFVLSEGDFFNISVLSQFIE